MKILKAIIKGKQDPGCWPTMRKEHCEKKRLHAVLHDGLQPARVVVRALALLELSDEQRPPQVVRNLRLMAKGVREIGWRYSTDGLERALYDKQRPGASPLLDASESQRIVAMVCSVPPEGCARWTARLIAEEAVKRKLVLGGRARDNSGR